MAQKTVLQMFPWQYPKLNQLRFIDDSTEDWSAVEHVPQKDDWVNPLLTKLGSQHTRFSREKSESTKIRPAKNKMHLAREIHDRVDDQKPEGYQILWGFFAVRRKKIIPAPLLKWRRFPAIAEIRSSVQILSKIQPRNGSFAAETRDFPIKFWVFFL